MSTLKLTKNTKIGFATLGDFTMKVALSKPNTTKQKPCDDGNIEYSEQLELIYKIYNAFESVNNQGEKGFKYLGRANDLLIERDYKSFRHAVAVLFKDFLIKGEYETINLSKLFLELKNKPMKNYLKINSYFIENDYYKIDDDTITLYKAKKISDVCDTSHIIEEKKREIISRYNTHWRGNLSIILDWLVAYKYAVNKKNAKLAILANSNFGKSKLFQWLEKFGEATFLNLDDFKKGGINDKSPDEYEDKLALVLDEANSFPRRLFDISDYMYIRPMRAKSVKVNVNAIVLLAYDGGSLNNTYVDKQVANRLTMIDLRKFDTKDLGDVMVGFTEAEVEHTIIEYLYHEVKRRVEEYKKMDNDLRRAEKAERVIKTSFEGKEGVTDLKSKKDFFETVREALEHIIESPKEALSYEIYNNVWLGNIKVTKKGVILLRQNTNLEKLLLDYDKSLKTELEHKDTIQILEYLGLEVKQHKIDGKNFRGVLMALPNKKEGGNNNDTNKYDSISTDIVNKYIIDYQAITNSHLLQTAEAVDHAKEELRLLKQSLENRKKNKKVS